MNHHSTALVRRTGETAQRSAAGMGGRDSLKVEQSGIKELRESIRPTIRRRRRVWILLTYTMLACAKPTIDRAAGGKSDVDVHDMPSPPWLRRIVSTSPLPAATCAPESAG